MVERLLWRVLRSDPEQRIIKFRYQHSLSPYIVDFVCLSARLIIEVDGASHDAMACHDLSRQKFLEEQGYAVMRFSNADVLNDVQAVAATIRHEAKKLLEERGVQTDPSPHAQARATLPQGEGGLVGGVP
jgi:leucyl-tRNA synthetase